MKKLLSVILLAALACCLFPAEAAQPSAPTPQRLPAASTQSAPLRADADFSPWESIGTCTLSDGIDMIVQSLNVYNYGAPEITFTKTSEVQRRQAMDNPEVVQYRFVKLFGYTDVVATINAVSTLGYVPQTVTSIPVPVDIAAQFDCKAIDFACHSIYYSPFTKVFEFNDAWFLFGDGTGFYCSFKATFADSKPDLGFYFTYKAGGLLSSDTHFTMSLKKSGVDHVRYITRFNGEFTAHDLYALAKGSCDYLTTSDEITLPYTSGFGSYSVLALAFDAEDNNMSIYRSASVRPNLPPEGTWKHLGKGVWHHYAPPYYYLTDFDTYETTRVDFPADKLSWPVDVEKRIDTDREIYRVVNPYSPDCGLAETFTSLLQQMYPDDESRQQAFRNDDTYWFVIDVTEPGHFTIEDGRRNGMLDDHFMTTQFFSTDFDMASATLDGNILRLPTKYTESADYPDLVVELPDQGSGIDNVNADAASAPAQYFDMQGRRVANPAPGIYLCRRGAKTEKIIIR